MQYLEYFTCLHSCCKYECLYPKLFTKEFIQKRLSYRYLVVQTDDSDKIVRILMRQLQNNEYGFGVPKLNVNINRNTNTAKSYFVHKF